MTMVPLSKPEDDERGSAAPGSQDDASNPVLRYAAAGTLVAGGVLFLSGCRRTGLLAAVIGTALGMIDQQEKMRLWWNALPVYLDEAQMLLNRIQGTVDEVTAQQQKLRDLFSREEQATEA